MGSQLRKVKKLVTEVILSVRLHKRLLLRLQETEQLLLLVQVDSVQETGQQLVSLGRLCIHRYILGVEN